MFATRMLRLPRKPFSELDYARHMPKEYVERMKRAVPRKVFDDRFGAPPITRWTVHPDDAAASAAYERPWEDTSMRKALEKSQKYHKAKLENKFYDIKQSKVKRMPDEQWTIFIGDLVEVMVGRHKGRQGQVIRVNRDTNEVLVEGLHTKLEKEVQGLEKMGLYSALRFKEQPLDVSKGQVKLVDPNNLESCEARWELNAAGDEYIRVSQSGYEIPVPQQAKLTYEYLLPEKYIEVEGKDTPSKIVLERTYQPRLMSFEEEIMSDMGIIDERKPKPTYWY